MNNKAKILASALKLFGTKGYEATGVQEIVSLAGITKPTLYHYFGNKQGLLETLLTQHNEKLNKRIATAAEYDGDLQESLIEVATAYFKFAKDNKNFYRMQLAMVFGPLEGDPVNLIRKLANPPYQSLQQLFDKALQLPEDQKNETCMAHAITFIGIVHQYITLFLNGIIELSKRITEFIVNSFVFGIIR